MPREIKGFFVDADWEPRPEAKLNDWETNNRFSTRGNNTWKNVRGQLRMDLPYPKCGDTQILLRILTCGICGSDVSLFLSDMDGYTGYASQCSFPMVPGHEFAGEVVEVGSKVTRFRLGDYVTCENIQWCGECAACRRGNVNQCENRISGI